jgi:hypothetical protein
MFCGFVKICNYRAGLIVIFYTFIIVESSGSGATGENMKTTKIEQLLRLTTVAIIPQATSA